MNRIKSYTVIELLVVMLISSLTIAITYSCYTIFSNHYLSYKRGSDELANYILLDRLLTKDVSGSAKIEKTDFGIKCVFRKDSVVYEFYDQYILRKNSIVDTFFIVMSEPVICKRIGKVENIPGLLIEEINLITIYKEEKLYFYYKKNYGANILMQLDNPEI